MHTSKHWNGSVFDKQLHQFKDPRCVMGLWQRCLSRTGSQVIHVVPIGCEYSQMCVREGGWERRFVLTHHRLAESELLLSVNGAEGIIENLSHMLFI